MALSEDTFYRNNKRVGYMKVKNKLTHFSLFTGIGGIDLAAEWAGFTTVGQCEIDEYATKVLEKNFPAVPRWKDIRDVTGESFTERTGLTELTLLSGGFPCQPHSCSGKRMASADERDLWGEFARVIREIRPRWILGENVVGLLSSENGRFFGRVLRDLDTMGYHGGWCCYPASWVGAAHRRERVFIVAHADGERRHSLDETEQDECEGLHFPIFEKWSPETYNTIFRLHRQIPERDSIIHRNDDGLSEGVDRLRCLGNAVCPQQIYPILETIAEMERNSEVYDAKTKK